MDKDIDMYLKQLAKETSLPEYMNMSHPKMDRVQFHLLAEQQRVHREMLERRGEELLELEITGDSDGCTDYHSGIKYSYKVTSCTNGHHHNIHVHDHELIIGKVYHFEYANHHHSGCYTVTEEHGHEGEHAAVVSGPWDSCAQCNT